MTQLQTASSKPAAAGAQIQKNNDVLTTCSPRFYSDPKKLSLVLVFFTVFVDMLGVCILMPVLPFLIGAKPHDGAFSSESMGGLHSGTAMALITGSFGFAQLVSTSVMGPLSDKFGRKALLVTSQVGSAVGYALQGVAIMLGSYWFLIGASVFSGLLSGSRPVAIAYIADSTPPAQRPRLIGKLALAVMVSFQIGPVLGGCLGSLHLAIPCYLAAGMSLISLFLVGKYIIEVEQHTKPQGAAGNANQGDRVALALIAFFSFTASFWVIGRIFSFTLLLPAEFNFEPSHIGFANMGDGIMILLGHPFYYILVGRMRVPSVGAIGCLLMTIVVVCPFLDLAPLLVFRYIASVGGPMALPAASAMTALIAPPPKRGKWASFTLGAQSLGRAVAPLALGPTFDVEYHLPFVICTATIFAGFLTCLMLWPRIPSPADLRPASPRKKVSTDVEAAGIPAPGSLEPSSPASVSRSSSRRSFGEISRKSRLALQSFNEDVFGLDALDPAGESGTQDDEDLIRTKSKMSIHSLGM